VEAPEEPGIGEARRSLVDQHLGDRELAARCSSLAPAPAPACWEQGIKRFPVLLEDDGCARKGAVPEAGAAAKDLDGPGVENLLHNP